MRDGRRVILRPLEPVDRVPLVTLFARLGGESRYRRFLSPKRCLTEREVAFFANVDHTDHEAVAAFTDVDGALVGVARYVVYGKGPTVAEVAVEIADDLHALGIGSALVRRLVRRALVNEIALLTATTLRDNAAARRLAARVGFRARGSQGREIRWELALPTAAHTAA